MEIGTTFIGSVELAVLLVPSTLPIAYSVIINNLVKTKNSL